MCEMHPLLTHGKMPLVKCMGSFCWIYMLSCFMLSLCTGFELEGSQTSFAKFPKWNPCQNGSFTFEFNTIQSNGLLLYIDDGGKFDFLELKLVAGAIRLRLNLGEGATILSAGQNLNDRQWHKVEVSRRNEDTTLIVDKESQTKRSGGFEMAFANVTKNSFVFVGGMPITYSAKLSLLALPSVMFEPRFKGSIRNMLYSNCGSPLERVDMIESRGVRTNQLDSCEEDNPCLHEGICVSTDDGAICDCSYTQYDGQFCQLGELPQSPPYLLGLVWGGYSNSLCPFSNVHGREKDVTGLDRESAHPLQLNTRKGSCCTAAKPAVTDRL